MIVLADWYLLCDLWYKLTWLCFMWRCSCFGDKALCHKGWLRQQAAHTAGPPKREQSQESALVPEKERSNDKDWVVSKRLTAWFCNSNISPLIHESSTKQMHRSDSSGIRLMIRKSNKHAENGQTNIGFTDCLLWSKKARMSHDLSMLCLTFSELRRAKRH